MDIFDMSRYASVKSVARNVAADILIDMLEYEGGELQSMSETAHCFMNNKKIQKYAEKHGISLERADLKSLGIK